MNELNKIISKFNTSKLDELIRIILYADKNFDNDSSFKNINFIKQTQRFDPALY